MIIMDNYDKKRLDESESNYTSNEEQIVGEELKDKGEREHILNNEIDNNEVQRPLHVNESKSNNKVNQSQRKQKRKGGRVFTAITSGIVSSILTFALVLYTPFFQEKGSVGFDRQGNERDIAQPTKDVAALSSNSSIVNMVEIASKGIVGIVKYNNEDNPFHLDNEGQQGVGSGVIFKKEGKYAYIVTNNHVIEN